MLESWVLGIEYWEVPSRVSILNTQHSLKLPNQSDNGGRMNGETITN